MVHVVPSLDRDMGGSVQAALLMSEALGAIDIESHVVGTFGASDRLAYIADKFDRVSYHSSAVALPATTTARRGSGRHLGRRAPHINARHVPWSGLLPGGTPRQTTGWRYRNFG
ncbi:MAG TPA: hypothetical protein VGR26_17690 [Acidimicrobiales bacterium]|nr:hypothetical protein [Acidimicrobiales bacterium]